MKSRTRLRDFTFTFHFHMLEKEMATHSSVLAWRIPGMGEPGEMPSMGSHPPLPPSLSPPCSERLHPWPKGIKAQTQLVLGWGWTACGSLVLPVSSMVHIAFSILRLYFLLSPQTLPASSPLDCLSPLLNPHPGRQKNYNNETSRRGSCSPLRPHLCHWSPGT